MSEPTVTNNNGSLDLRADGRLILCACELRTRLEEFEEFGDLDSWQPGESFFRDNLARNLIESAMNIREQIENMNREGLA